MISVIVPIYNVEAYLKQCIDSIITQTYTDLEIILIDDGSTDNSGEIADSYSDKRIKVFHTSNHGLSAARNIGIDNAHGEYLFFVDSDDWLEEDILESALNKMCESDILCIGVINESDLKSVFSPIEPCVYYGGEALDALLNDKILNVVWNKLYRKECFSNLRFPEGRICEDMATTYKLLRNASSVKLIDEYGYHYRIRRGSLSRIHDKRNMIEYWQAISDRFYDCKDTVTTKQGQINLYKSCAWAIMRAWAWRNTIPNMQQENDFYSELSSFAKKQFPDKVLKQLPINVRIGVLFARYNHPFSFWLSNKILVIERIIHGKTMD